MEAVNGRFRNDLGHRKDNRLGVNRGINTSSSEMAMEVNVHMYSVAATLESKGLIAFETIVENPCKFGLLGKITRRV
ncbi:MAG: hypothetical protein OK439_03780 [Thaumarchaeota archaeon]|nr:hypothetical protein [Nitrososphaerota archaeon]